MGSSLVAFDTDHIKRYVFGTNKLKEIRGASSLLDYLNRIVMTGFAENYHAEKVYASGGSGLFLVPTEHSSIFMEQVQRAYHDLTGGGASITSTCLSLSEEDIENIGNHDLTNTLELLQWQLLEEKAYAPKFVALPSHPFMRLCDACGIEYTNASEEESKKVPRDPGEENEQYCTKCQKKRFRDESVKDFIAEIEEGKRKPYDEPLWDQLISRLRTMKYDIPPLTERPADFNVFRNFKGAKDYLALIYADGNNMGSAMEEYDTLNKRERFAETIDEAIYTSVCTAIKHHLKIEDHLKPRELQVDDLKHPVFPFDILLLGGDDVYIVVPATVAMDVALTIAETFHTETNKERTLSVGVVLAPVKYPFGLLREMAETTLQFAKKDGADARADARRTGKKLDDDTRINFMVVTGGSSSNFKSVYNNVYRKLDDDKHEFQATLRPYTPSDLRYLLAAIRGKDGADLGRTKLHQIREAVFKMNLTTSVIEGLAVLRNWRQKQRNYVVNKVYEFAGRYQMPRSNPDDPVSGFPRVVFPWFADGKKPYKNTEYEVYRTPLLDFIELYDFVSKEGGDNDQD